MSDTANSQCTTHVCCKCVRELKTENDTLCHSVVRYIEQREEALAENKRLQEIADTNFTKWQEQTIRVAELIATVAELKADHKKSELLWWDEKGALEDRIAELEAENKRLHVVANHVQYEQLKAENEKLSKQFYEYEIASCYKGNSIRHWYNKAQAYGTKMCEFKAENERLTALLITNCEAPMNCIGPLIKMTSASQYKCGRCFQVGEAIKEKDDE